MENENIKIWWQRLKLNDLGFIGRWKSKHRPRDDKSLFWWDYPFIQTADVKHVELYITKYNETYSEKWLQQSKLWKKWTLCITIAANISESGILMFDACFPDSIVWFIADEEKSNTKYVKYLLDTLKLHFQQISKWTTQDNLSLDKLLSIDFLVPPLDIQNKIADALSAYDDLIENNNRRIQILEQTAQEVYKEWFVNFKFPWYETIKIIDSETDFWIIPEWWNIENLWDRIKILKWKNITKSTITPWDIPVIAWWISPAYYHNKPNVNWPVITISASGANAGYIRLYYQDIWASDCSYISKDNSKFIYYYFLLLKDKQINITNLQVGSAQPHVYPKDIISFKVIIPNNDIIADFETKITPIFHELSNLENQNNNLIKTRDLLLPKLISWEIDVSELEII